MPVTIAFLGDTLLGDRCAELLRARGFAYAFDSIRPLLAPADLVVANLEGVLSTEAADLLPTPHRARYWLRAEPASAWAMREAGIGVVSLANNHILDYGLDGLMQTRATLGAAGILHCGAGLTDDEARRPAIATVNGLRIGFFSWVQRYDLYADWLYASDASGGCNRLRESVVSADLNVLREQADVRIALVHWGRTYRTVTTGQQRWASRLVQAGADLVIGHHPHIAQPVTLVAGQPVIYSLGNGPFGTHGGFERYGQPGYGLILLAEFADSGRLMAMQLHLIDVDNARTACRPVPITGDTAISALRSLTDAAYGWRPHGDALRLDGPYA